MRWRDRKEINSFIALSCIMIFLVIFSCVSIIILSYYYKKGAILLSIIILFILLFILFFSMMKLASIYEKLMIKFYNKERR